MNRDLKRVRYADREGGIQLSRVIEKWLATRMVRYNGSRCGRMGSRWLESLRKEEWGVSWVEESGVSEV